MCETFVSEMPRVEVEDGTVKTTWRSGETEYVSRSTRGFMRRYLETALRILNDHEAAEREERRIVAFRAG